MRPLKAATEPMRDDAAAAPLHHAARHRLAGQDGGEQIALQHRAHVGLLDVHRVVRVGLAAGGCDVAAGIVHENVDRAERRFGLGDHARDVLAPGEVAEHALAADAELLADLCARPR